MNACTSRTMNLIANVPDAKNRWASRVFRACCRCQSEVPNRENNANVFHKIHSSQNLDRPINRCDQYRTAGDIKCEKFVKATAAYLTETSNSHEKSASVGGLCSLWSKSIMRSSSREQFLRQVKAQRLRKKLLRRVLSSQFHQLFLA